MRVSARFVAAAALAASASLAQPYGMLEDSPGYWHPLGRFDSGFDGEHTGYSAAFTHYGYNADPKTFSAISVMQSYEEEQLKPGKGSYWQSWTFVMAKCGQGTVRVTEQIFYNKPRFQGSSADELWRDKYGGDLDDKYFFKPKPGTLGEAVVKAACSEPVGANI